MTNVSSAAWSRRYGAATAQAVQVYEDVFVPRLFMPFGRRLLDVVGVHAGDDVLDVATGPGTVARSAAERGARVAGCDLSPAMVALARELSPGVAYMESSAAPLPAKDQSFDVVVCQQGLQFFPDRPAALAEMRRVVRPGGRVGLAVWGPLEQCDMFAHLAVALTEAVGPEAGATYAGGPWSLTDAGELARLVAEAGFADVEVSAHRLPVAFEGGAAQLLRTLAVTAVADRVAALSAVERERLHETLAQALAPLADEGGGVRGEITTHIATGVR